MNQHADKVLLTRRRWDAYLVPLFLASVAVGIIGVVRTGQFQFLLQPIGVIPLWLMLRLLTPREGMKVSTIRSTPGAVTVLWSAAAAVVAFLILLVIDVYVLRHRFQAPLEWYHALLFSPPLIIMFTGVYLAERVKHRRKMKDKRIQPDSYGGKPEEPSPNKSMQAGGEVGRK